MATATVARLLAFRTGPIGIASEKIGRIDVEMTKEASIAKEGTTSAAPPTFPIWMVDPTQMAETRGGRLFRPHEIIDRAA